MFNISPLSGYTRSTQFVSSPFLTGDYIINWGDGLLTDATLNTHYYTSAGIYNVVLSNCESTSSQQITAFVDPNIGYADTIYAVPDYSSTTFTSKYNQINIYTTTINPESTIFLYSSGSSSQPYSDDESFWNFLKPTWSFYDSNYNPISQISLTGTPSYSGQTILGYTTSAFVFYKDDSPGIVNLFFTIRKHEQSVDINSRSYAAIPFAVSAIPPNNIRITSDGLNNMNLLQWADHSIPYVVTINNTNHPYSNMIHYASGYLTEVKYTTTCNNVSSSEYQSYLQTVDPYVINNFFIPSSAFPSDSIYVDSVQCGVNPYEKIRIDKVRKFPNQLTISATGVFNVDGTVYNLSGISTPFNIYKFENFHDFYRKGEDVSVYDLIKKYSYIDLDKHENFNSYLSAIAGQGDSLGLVYDRIQNFANDHTDLDVCTVDSLKSLSEQYSVDMDNFDLHFPEELKRMMNFFSVPLQKLIGTRCQCNQNFAACSNFCNNNVCNLCGFDKRSNLGKQLMLNDYITAGQTILYKETGSDVYNFLNVKSQDNVQSYPLRTLTASNIVEKGITNFCYYEWDATPQNNPVQGLVNYNDSRNSLSPTLTSYSDWYGDGGVIEEVFNYILTKNLVDS